LFLFLPGTRNDSEQPKQLTKNKKAGGSIFARFENVFQSYSNQTNIVLAKKDTPTNETE
jgi:hypothetical protein